MLPTGVGAVGIGSDPYDLVAAGLMTYDGPEFTPEVDGYLCGFGISSGPYGPDSFSGMMKERGLERIYTTDTRFHTPEGFAVGMSETMMYSLLGGPTETYPHPYVATQFNHYYRIGDYGMVFTVESVIIIEASVGFYDAMFYAEGCL